MINCAVFIIVQALCATYTCDLLVTYQLMFSRTLGFFFFLNVCLFDHGHLNLESTTGQLLQNTKNSATDFDNIWQSDIAPESWEMFSFEF